jgi:two-component system chemotaxis response regulator CheB
VIKLADRSVRLLLVDPSPGARERLRQLFSQAPDMEVVGEAGTIEKALRLLEETDPTEVVIDCDLPQPGSFAAVREIMAVRALPIVMVAKQGEVAALEVNALDAGAVALTSWRPSCHWSTPEGQELIRLVRTMSEVKVVRRRGRDYPVAIAESQPSTRGCANGNRVQIVAIGASTGGPPVLQKILSGLPRPLPVPVVLVQHLSPGFQGSLVSWLTTATGVTVLLGEHGMSPRPGIAYLAPDDRHMTVDASGHLVLSDDAPENGSRPSVSALFRSVAEQYGPSAIGILLTGMGRDGAKELRLMRDRGAITIAQDEETSIVHGMPGEAIKLKGARYVLAPERIASVVHHHLLRCSTQGPDQEVRPLTAAREA